MVALGQVCTQFHQFFLGGYFTDNILKGDLGGTKLQTDRRMDVWTDGCVYGCTNGLTDDLRAYYHWHPPVAGK